MNIRPVLPVVLLSIALALTGCGNKGPLVQPPPPEEGDWPDADADVDPDDPTPAADGDGGA